MKYPCHVCANTMLPGVTYTIPREYDPTKPSCGKVYHYYQGTGYPGMASSPTLAECGFCKGAGMVEERRMSRGPRRRKADRRAMLSQPEELSAQIGEAHVVLDKAEISRKRSLDGGKTWPEYSLAERVRIVCNALKMPVDPDSEEANPVWDLVIEKCHSAYPERQGMNWNESPLELITEIINDRDEAVRLLADGVKLSAKNMVESLTPSPHASASEEQK